jgi:hypothetical protein
MPADPVSPPDLPIIDETDTTDDGTDTIDNTGDLDSQGDNNTGFPQLLP